MFWIKIGLQFWSKFLKHSFSIFFFSTQFAKPILTFLFKLSWHQTFELVMYIPRKRKKKNALEFGLKVNHNYFNITNKVPGVTRRRGSVFKAHSASHPLKRGGT